MEKSFREKIADLFNEAESDNSHYDISMTKMFVWLGVTTMVSSLTPFIFPGGYTLIKTFSTLIILLFATANPAFKWAAKLKKQSHKK